MTIAIVLLAVLLLAALWIVVFAVDPHREFVAEARAHAQHRPSGDRLLDHSRNDDLADWPAAIVDAVPPPEPDDDSRPSAADIVAQLRAEQHDAEAAEFRRALGEGTS